MFNFKTFFFLSVFTIPVVHAESTTFSSKLFANQQEQSTETANMDSDNKVDFFELAKKNQTPEAPNSWESASETANMSPHDRTQYYFNNQNYGAVNSEINAQRMQNLERAKNRGAITNKQYQKGLSQRMPTFPASNSNGVKFNIPF